ncbi:MAG: S-methyl-5-thioribose-1-phosphate isomerase [Candidatus Sumerlaeia bacterium]|nr:S-methyl-5-thioribose-1-phosphate isomerase [Candidatus Sumerlaeia bacterium]
MPPVETIEWTGRDVRIIDQTLLPGKTRFLAIKDEKAMWEAIKKLRVRGAPAIGVAAGYGVFLAVRAAKPGSGAQAVRVALRAADYLATSRPTAVNLFWALDRCRAMVRGLPDAATAEEVLAATLAEALAIHESDRATCAAIGRHGAPLLDGVDGVLTHCNAGALATGGMGTALALIYEAAKKRRFTVYADETRPLLQGARLTAWELAQAGIDTVLITDSMAATVLSQGRVQAVVVGADRIAANGDTANKVGTMPLAILAAHFKVPLYVAAPLSTVDLSTGDGSGIPVEERGAEEVTSFGGTRVAPKGVRVFSPAFDVTPAKYVSAIVTEAGVLRPPYKRSLKEAFRAK